MLPTVFVSHGSPMHAIDAGRAGDVWAELGRTLPRPSAVLIASAHWETELPMLSTTRQPETIHDFGGFPPELYKISYPAPGAPDISERAIQMLQSSGVTATANACRGLDHGAWVPLRRMFPNADVPVAQVSIQPSLDAAHHLRVGERAGAADARRRADHRVRTYHAQPARLDGKRAATRFARGSRRCSRSVRHRVSRMDCRQRWQATIAIASYAGASSRRTHYVRIRRPSISCRCSLHSARRSHRGGQAPRVERLDAGVDSGVLAMDAYVFWPHAAKP